MFKDKVKNKLGFMLSELLMVVAIIAVLFALAVPAIFTIQRNLRQKELDTKAQTIYTAVQNRLSELYSSGKSDLYNPKSHNELICMNTYPGDYDETMMSLNSDSVYYLINNSNNSDYIKDLLGDSTLDNELFDGHWVIELLPYTYQVEGDTSAKNLTAATVYAVYYSEEKLDVTSEYVENGSVSDLYLTKYRSIKYRKNKSYGNAYVGYYGGSDLNSSNSTSDLQITSIDITDDKAINNAIVKIRLPRDLMGNVYATFTFEDAYGNSRVYSYDIDSKRLVLDGKEIHDNNITISQIGRTYSFTFTLDDLSSNETRFDKLFGSTSTYSSKLVTGSDIKLSVNTTSDDYTVKPDNKSTIGNSIYAYNDTGSTTLNQSSSAYIANARHLQNLDTTGTNVTIINKAILLNDISFKDENDNDFYTSYSNKYFNGKVNITKINSNGSTTKTNVVNFKSIENSYLNTIEGNGYSILNLSSNNNGLLNNVNNDLTISNLSMVGTRINNTNNTVGSFIGTINSGNVTLDHCYSYLSSNNNDIPTSITADYKLESIVWLNGSTVGGLVGNNAGNLTITNSFASSVLGNKNSLTGGLVGINNNQLTIDKSYADSYLYGYQVAGLVAANNNTLNISSSYAAGYIGLNDNDSSIAAGLVSGSANVTDSYTIVKCYSIDNKNGISKESIENGKYYSTVVIGNVNNVYYNNGSSNSEYDIEGTSNSLDNISLNDNFVTSDSNSNPYKLMGQSLSSYKYPKIKDLDHYGDWDATFIGGSLVYYEEYDNGSVYGFEGANVDITLRNDLTLTGDGYGVVFRNSDGIPTLFTVNDVTYNTKDITPYTVVNNGNTYYIYPLNKSTINPDYAINNYYVNATVVSKYSDNESTLYFRYNPHFARSVVDVDNFDNASTLPSIVSVRSSRQLYNLSLYYDNGYKAILGNVAYTQERNIDYTSYNWISFYTNGSINTQAPIGASSNTSFSATYNGSGYEINHVNFVTDSGYYVGMFGYNDGTIKNVALVTQYDSNNYYYIKRNQAARSNTSVYYGVLAGYNNGTIDNCAMAGYYLSGAGSSIHGYENSYVYVGGLVGYNNDTITNSSADGIEISLSMYRANCYGGALVGYNQGSINNAYGINHLVSDVQGGSTIISGFAGYNGGTIANSYCATALTSSGDGSSAYAFAPNTGSGSVSNSYYLFRGSYNFANNLYSYNNGDSNSSGTYKTYSNLKDLRSNNVAKVSKYHDLTNETTYPYKAVVTNASGQLVHYGEWQIAPKLGTYGIFYWEKEESGQNNGYKLTYIGISENSVMFDSTLCDNHDDGGIISEYGYGYYVIEGSENDISVSSSNIALSKGTYNADAQTTFNNQIAGLKFYPYTTTTDTSGSYIYLDDNSGEKTYGSVTLSLNGNSTTFDIAPFFANSMSMHTNLTSSNSKANQYINTTVGSSSNNFEVRSSDQLQYINWNSNKKNTNTLVDENSYTYYPYLMYTSNAGQSTQTIGDANHNALKDTYFTMSHDIDASNISNFTPIAGQATSSDNSGYSATLYAWFGSSFDGQSYKIQELNINSKAYTVGLFGVTVAADIKNIILYSSKDAIIQRSTTSSDDEGAYAIGGLVGIAYDYKSATNKQISNCAIAGYKIIDDSKNQQGLGEANVGGLVGVANVNIDRSSAVVDIIIQCTHEKNGSFTQANSGNYIRVGGITGAIQNKITNSYSGGTISVIGDVLNETYNTSTNSYYNNQINTASQSQANRFNSTNIFIAGIAGSGFTMTYKNFENSTGIKDGNPYVENCYTYITFPKMEGTIRNITMITSMADRFTSSSTGGEHSVTINNCYYLASSAAIDYSNLPKYYFKYDQQWNWGYYYSYYSPANVMNTTYFNNMINGGSDFIAKVFENQSTGLNTILSSNTLTPKTYDQLSDSTGTNMASLLGSSFGWVSVEDDYGQTVNGKYSFPGSDSSLQGKNYPFPTVIKQTNNNKNVHYGKWPHNGAYWENSIDTLDIFDNMNNLGYKNDYAYKTFTLKKLADKDFTVNSITIDGESSSDYIDIVKQEKTDESYVITVRAKKTGSVKINANITSEGATLDAEFELTVTAKLNVTTSKSELTLNSGDTGSFEAYAKSSSGVEYNINSNITWSNEVTKINEENAVTVTNNSKNYTVEGTGYNANISVIASYDYHGETFVNSAIVTVKRTGMVGLGNNVKNFNEANISASSSETINGSDVTDNTSPIYTSLANNGDTFYLYSINDNDLLSGAKSIDAKVTLNEDETREVTVSVDKDDIKSLNINDENVYTVIPVSVTCRSHSLGEAVDIKKLEVTIVKDDKTYILVLENQTIYTTPYSVTLDGNGGIFDNNETITSMEYSFTEDNKVDDDYILDLEDCEQPTRTGYEFVGYTFVKNDESTLVDNEVKLSELNSDVTYYALWQPISVTFILNGKETTDIPQSVTVEYDALSVGTYSLPISDISVDGYLFGGWYLDNDSKDIIIKKDGTFTIGKDSLNELILQAYETDDKSLTFNPLFTKQYTINFKTINTDGSEVTLASTKVINGDSGVSVNIENITEGYTLLGWYSSTDNSAVSVFDTNGNIDTSTTVDYISNESFNISEDISEITVYAKWRKEVTINGYILTDSFDKNGTYLIANTNQAGDGYVMIAQEYDNDSLRSSQVSVKSYEDIIYIDANDVTDSAKWTYVDARNNRTNRLRNTTNGTTRYAYSNGTNLRLSSDYGWDSKYQWQYSNNMLTTRDGERYLEFNSSEKSYTFDSSPSKGGVYHYSYLFKYVGSQTITEDTFIYHVTSNDEDTSQDEVDTQVDEVLVDDNVIEDSETVDTSVSEVEDRTVDDTVVDEPVIDEAENSESSNEDSSDGSVEETPTVEDVETVEPESSEDSQQEVIE